MKRKQMYALLLSAAMVTSAVPVNAQEAGTAAETSLEESGAQNDSENAKDSTLAEENVGTDESVQGQPESATAPAEEENASADFVNDRPVIDYGAVDYVWEVEATNEPKLVEDFLLTYANPDEVHWASCSDGIKKYVVTDGGYEYSQIDFKKPGDYKLNICAESNAGVLSYNIGITVRIQDTTAPTVEVPDEFKVQEFPLTNETLTDEQIVKAFVNKEWISDIVSENCSVTYRRKEYPFDPSTEGTYNLMFQAKDAAGNNKKFTIKVKVTDQEGPKIDHSKVSAAGGYQQSLEATQDDISPLQFVDNEWLTDNNKNGDPHFVFDRWFNDSQEKPFDPKTPGEYKLNYYTEDAAGNRGWSMGITVTVKDTMAPTVTIPEDAQPVKFTLTTDTVDEAEIISSVVNGGWITDNASGELTIDYIEEKSDFNPDKKGIYTLPFTVTDASGNKTAFEVKVQVVDENGPVINYDQIAADNGYNQTFEASKKDMSYEDIAKEFTWQRWATDDSDEPVTFICDWYFNEHLSGKPFNPAVPGEYTLRFSVQDASGNPGNGVFDVNVEVKDRKAPVVKVPDNMKEQEFDLAQGAMTEDQIKERFVDQKWITDNAEGVVTVDYLEEKSDFNPQKLGTYKLYFTASDESGNKSEEFVIKVTVVDHELPTIDYGQINADGGYSKTIEVDPKAMTFDEMTGNFTRPNWAQDNSNDVEIKCDEYVFKNGITVDGRKYPAFDSTKKGTYALQFYAEDGSGNISTQKFIVYVTVEDTTAPEVKVDGPWERTHERGEVFTVPEAAVTDNSGEKLEAVMDRVTYAETKEELDTSTDYSSEVDVNRLGWYKLRYCATDSSGNKGYATIIVHVEDTIAPEGNVSYSTTKPTNQPVTVTITGSEAITAEGWIQDTKDPKVLTKVYNENAAETVTITDIGGNTATVEVNVANIDKTAPKLTVTMDPNGPTNKDVTVTIKADEAIEIADESWTKKADDTWTKVYTENVSGEEVTAVDPAGNTAKTTITITNIDKENPVLVSSEYSTTDPTNEDVTVTLKFNEAVTVGTEGWTSVDEQEMVWSKVFTENAAEDVAASDAAGNSITVPVKVENIDKEAPQIEVAYSVTNPTNEDVTVTLKANEAVKVIEGDGGWKAVSDTELAKTFGDNVDYTVKVADAAGNITVVEVTIANIDKDAPKGTVEYSTTDPTNEDVKATVHFTEPVVVDGKGWIVDSADQTVWMKLFTENAEETITAADAAGNTVELAVKADNIDKTAPVISGVENGKTYTDKVTAVIEEENLAEVTVNGTACEYKDKLVFAKDGKYTLAATDTAGNRTEVSFEVKLPKKTDNNTQNDNTNGTAAKTGDSTNGALPAAGVLAGLAAVAVALRKILGR